MHTTFFLCKSTTLDGCILLFYSCVIAASGNLASQYISGVKAVNRQNLLAFAAFG